MTTTQISFDAFTTDAGVGECYILRGSEVVGHVSRERPTKYHGNGVGGLPPPPAQSAPYRPGGRGLRP